MKKGYIEEKYYGDSRYEKVWEQMQLLGIEDVSTMRQEKNGTITWRLPIQNQWNNGSLIEVGSFASGYVRNNNSCSTNYQLNKRCDSEPSYYPERDYNGKKTGKYVQYTARTCKLIPIEIERLEYLISYCLKNYYIKHANLVPNGEYIPKWMYENTQKSSNLDFNGHHDRIRDLENKLDTIQRISDHG